MKLLRRHVWRAADDRRAMGRNLEESRGAEIAHLQEPAFGDQHVAGTEIAVQDAGSVRMVDGVADLTGEIEGPVQVERPVAHDDVLERLAGDVLHHDEEDVILLLGRQDGHDVRMAHRCQQTRLFEHLAEIEVLLVRDLEGDLLVNPGVLGQIDAAEAAAPKGRQNPVLPDGLAAEEHDRIIQGGSPRRCDGAKCEVRSTKCRRAMVRRAMACQIIAACTHGFMRRRLSGLGMSSIYRTTRRSTLSVCFD